MNGIYYLGIDDYDIYTTMQIYIDCLMVQIYTEINDNRCIDTLHFKQSRHM